MDADDVTSVVANQHKVLTYIVATGGLAKIDTSTGDIIDPPANLWFRVAEWGFNVGRQDCEIYMDNLFRMSREKQRGDALLGGLGSATTAILTATSASPTALSVLASAFGLSIVVNDAVFQSYLFTQAPGLVANKVQDLQNEYRASVENASDALNTPEQAYNAIQHYYSICLPHSIEGTLLAAVSDTKTAMKKPSGAAGAPKKTKKTKTGASAADLINARPVLIAN